MECPITGLDCNKCYGECELVELVDKTLTSLLTDILSDGNPKSRAKKRETLNSILTSNGITPDSQAYPIIRNRLRENVSARVAYFLGLGEKDSKFLELLKRLDE